MSESLEKIEIRIAYLEKANSELSDVVYQQRLELEALRARLSEWMGRMEAAQAQTAAYSAEEEKPPHY
jgi:SlyX protein